MKIIPVDHVDEVLELALTPAPKEEKKPRTRKKKEAPAAEES
jgi:predicted ATP-dependent protease